MRKPSPLVLLVACSAALAQGNPNAPSRTAAPEPGFPTAAVADLAWRNLGPSNPVGRLTDIAVHPARQSTWWIGSAGGGLWQTTNAGTTWTNVSNRWTSVSIGAIAIAPSNPDVIWVGTGEENARNSVQWGDGVMRSLDGGATWQAMGLRETFQIGHIEIHPTNPDIVYVAALGPLWGDEHSEHRGVYKTSDGGGTWQRVLFLDAVTGCIDVRVHAQDPEVVFACMYERHRDGFDGNDPVVRFGSNSGLYKSRDGGANWQRLSQGLPNCQWGRSGIDLLPGTDTVYLIAETERSGWARGDRKDAPRGSGTGQPNTALLGVAAEGGDGTAEQPGALLTELTEGGAAAGAGLAVGDRVTKIGEKSIATYAELLETVRAAAGGDKVAITLVRDGKEQTLEVTYGTRPTGGQGQGPGQGGGSFPNGPFGGRLNGQQANKQTEQGELGYQTGGVFRSDDRGETWQRINSLTERPFYYSVLRVDPQDRNNLYSVGTSLWGSRDAGVKFVGINNNIHVDFHALWLDPDDAGHLLAGCDGGLNESWDYGKSWRVHAGFCAAQYYDVVADNSVPYRVIGGLQDNGTWIGPSRVSDRGGTTRDDWVTINGGDGFGAQTDPVEPHIVYCTSQNGALSCLDLRANSSLRLQHDRPQDGTARWNWDAPFVLSPHNRLTLYHAGSHVFRGERHLQATQTAAPSQGGFGRGPSMRMRCISPNLGLSEAGTAVAIAESPRVMGLLYVGTDDGALWRSEDGGQWTHLEGNLPTLGPRYVSDLVPSHSANDRLYLTLDGHRVGDMHTYVFASEDRGATWRSLSDDLPTQEPCYAVMEDPRNENLLFLGTEYSCYVSLDRGQTWRNLGNNLPTVAVRDLFIQDRDSDLVIATHGRGVWTIDIQALRQCSASVLAKPSHLFTIEPTILWRGSDSALQGHAEFRVANPATGALLYLWHSTAPSQAPEVTIHDVAGKQVAKLTGTTQAGLQVLHWNAREQRTVLPPGEYAARFGAQTQLLQLLPEPTPAAAF